MSDELWRESLAAFRAALAADAPAPGCGAAAAVTADLGLALVVKALRISRRHADSVALAEQLAQAESLLGRLGRFADEDMQAFSDYLQAAQRGDEARDLAARQACAVPLASAHGCLQGLEIAVVARPLVRGALSSDVHAGGAAAARRAVGGLAQCGCRSRATVRRTSAPAARGANASAAGRRSLSRRSSVAV
ncbi:cyclodeaminase/cyclohydrolase family protein [Stutzerimonas balearica]|uniref:cyclodeaminase/cyclohydrolase family protein n=1 Tax=Stutzerimonas balearica TaxID=74829 RepID=UPI00384F0AF2